MNPKIVCFEEPFTLECATVLPRLKIAYHTYGDLSHNKPVVWICHALTGSSDVASWWKGFVGDESIINPSNYFIVCANVIGSCYGSTGPLSIDDIGSALSYSNFPMLTIRDMVKAHIMLCKYLGIKFIDLLIGPSFGGYQALEWSIMQPLVIKKMLLIASNAKETAWAIALHAAQRMAIEADSTWSTLSPIAGSKGLKAARAMGLLIYRSFDILKEKQTDDESDKVDNFKASSYVAYQGEKLVKRFSAFSYFVLQKSMDSHNIARGRGGNVESQLKSIAIPALIIGINGDMLCPVSEVKKIADNMPNATFALIDSLWGHDGFLVETKKIASLLKNWQKSTDES